MKIIDGENLLKDIKKMDLEFMQQQDVIMCIEDIIDRQPELVLGIDLEKLIREREKNA